MKIISLIGFLCGCVLLGLIMNARAQQSGRQTLRVISIPGIPLPVVIAKEHGFFAQYALEVEAEAASSSDVLRATLASGKADIAHAAVDNAVAMGDNSALIVMGGESSLNELIAQPEIRSIAELRGQTLIVDAPNTAFALQLKKILLDKGLRGGRDYEIKPIGTTPQRFQAMRQHKEFAASMLGPPTSLLAKQQGFISLASTQEAIGPYQAGGAFVLRTWANANHDPLVRYLAAYIEAQRWLLAPQNQTQVTDLLMKQWHLPEALAHEGYVLLRSGTWFEPDARFDIDGFNNVLKLRAEVEHQWEGHPPAAERFYEPAYYQEALAKLAGRH